MKKRRPRPKTHRASELAPARPPILAGVIAVVAAVGALYALLTLTGSLG